MNLSKLAWQSKFVLLLVLPVVASGLVLQIQWWALHAPPIVIWTLGLSLLLALVTWKLHAASPAAALTGAAITASLMFSTVIFPYQPWRTALVPVLAVAVLAYSTTRLGRQEKQRMGLAERHSGRTAAQVAANLGVAALISSDIVQGWLVDNPHFAHPTTVPMPMFAIALAALSGAAADTVSSEVGEVFGGLPRMITTLRQPARRRRRRHLGRHPGRRGRRRHRLRRRNPRPQRRPLHGPHQLRRRCLRPVLG